MDNGQFSYVGAGLVPALVFFFVFFVPFVVYIIRSNYHEEHEWHEDIVVEAGFKPAPTGSYK